MSEKIIRSNLYFGLVGISFSAILLILGSSFMQTWFYTFSWWSVILILDSLNFRRSHASPLYDSAQDFAALAFISVFIWLVFELFNLRLKNWSYHSLPGSTFERWLGFFLAFATVVPALKELSLFFKHNLAGKKLALFRLRMTPALLNIFFFLGVISLILPLIWPSFFFPLVWLGFLFLLEPINYQLKNASLMRDLENKDWTRFWSWLLAGLSAGILWELFNFWAGSHWEYSLPWFNFGRIFQMPVLGYSGFLPFALGIFAFYTLLFHIRRRIWGKRWLKTLICGILILFYIVSFLLIDSFTVMQ